MKTRILASIITGVLATSAAQADSAFSIRDLDVIYSGLNPSVTRDIDVRETQIKSKLSSVFTRD